MDDNYISRLTTIEFPGLEPAAAPFNDNEISRTTRQRQLDFPVSCAG